VTPTGPAAADRPDVGGGPHLLDARSAHGRSCRCGLRIPAGSPFLEIGGLPGDLTSLFHQRAFCSQACVRAYFLETLSELEGLDTPFAETQVTDLRETYAELASVFAKLLVRLPRRGSEPGDRSAG